MERRTEESLKVSAKKPPSWCALRLSFPTISEDFTISDNAHSFTHRSLSSFFQTLKLNSNLAWVRFVVSLCY